VRRALIAPALAALTVAAPLSLSAQMASTLDAGAVRVRAGGGDAESVVSLTPALMYEHARGVLFSAATLSRFDGGGEAVQAVVAGSFFALSRDRLHLSAGGTAEGGAFGSSVQTGRLLGDLRLHWVHRGYGAWAAGTGGVAHDSELTRRTQRGEFGAWIQHNAVTLSSMVAPTSVQDGPSFTDVEASTRWAVGAFEVAGLLGLRSGGEPGSSAWGWGSVTYWFTPHLALVSSGGSYPADPAQSLGGGDFVSLGLRLASRPSARRVERRPTAVLPPVVARPVVAGFEVRNSSSGSRTIMITAPAARVVEIMGDFTAWEAVRLQPSGADRWRFTIAIPAGVHRFNVRVDGGEWGVPPNVTVLQDEFSGVVAVLHFP
jgi:hypothetical protein